MLAALALNARWLPTWLSALLLPMAVIAIIARWRGSGPLPAVWRLLLLVGVSVAIATTQSTFFGREAGAALLSSMLVLKLLETSNVRDARLVVMVSNFLALAAFLHSQSLAQTIATSSLLVLGLVALQWLRIDRVDAAAGAPEPSAREWRVPLREALVTLAVVVPFAIVSFLLFPRLGSPLWGGAEQSRSRVGIDDELELGALSGVALNDDPAFRVRFDRGVEAPAAPDRYWRGLVLWNFDGRVWKGAQRFAHTRADDAVETLGKRLEYEITLAEPPRLWRFALDAPLTTPAGFRRTADLQITGPPGAHAERRYRVISSTRFRLQAKLPDAQRQAALRIPVGGNPRARALGLQWRQRHGENAGAIVSEALSMVRRDFLYSLDPPPLGANAIDEFLFTTRIGFCEHFASSFVFLMRAAGIPARIVTGYQGGYRNAIGGYWLVRQSDAHAWAEVWQAGSGWIRVDPTGAVAPERVMRGGAGFAEGMAGGDWLVAGSWWSGMRDRVDVLAAVWQRTVIDFDYLRQGDLLRSVGIPEGDRTRQLLLWLALVFASLGVAALVLMLRGGRPTSPWVALYRRFAARLARGGVVRRIDEGPAHFAERAATELPVLASEIRAIAAEFIALRYAAEVLPPETERIRLRRLRTRLKRLRVHRRSDASAL